MILNIAEIYMITERYVKANAYIEKAEKYVYKHVMQKYISETILNMTCWITGQIIQEVQQKILDFYHIIPDDKQERIVY